MPRDEAPFESSEVTRLHVPNVLRLLPLVALLPQLPNVLRHALDLPPDVLAMISLGTNVAMFVAIFAFLKRLNDRNAETGRLRASSEGVHWNGALVLPREKIVGGVVMPDAPGGTRVRLTRRGRRGVMEFGVANVEQGRSLLRALGLDAAQVTATFHARSPIASVPLFAVTAIVGVMAAAFVAASFQFPPFVALVPFLVLMITLAWPQKVVVGTDGVLLRWMLRRNFVPYDDLARIDDTKTGLELVTRSGRRHLVEFNSRRASKTYQVRARAERDSLRSRIEQAKAAAPDAAPALDPGVVARGERDVTAWLASLRDLARREGGMRTAPVLREQLFAILANTHLAASVRAGAAAALGLDAADAERARLREVAASIASPRVRVVVEAAAQGNEPKIVAALDEVHDDEAKKRASG